MDLDKEELKVTRVNNGTLWTEDSMEYIIQCLILEMKRNEDE